MRIADLECHDDRVAGALHVKVFRRQRRAGGRLQQARENRADRRLAVGAQRLVVEREERRGVVGEELRRSGGVTAADGIDERACHAFGRADGRGAGKYKDREERGAAQWPRRAGSRKSGWFCSSPTIRSSPLLL
jgi:hypothetical protein